MENLEDEDFIAKVLGRSKNTPDSGRGWKLNIKVREKEKNNQDLKTG